MPEGDTVVVLRAEVWTLAALVMGAAFTMGGSSSVLEQERQAPPRHCLYGLSHDCSSPGEGRHYSPCGHEVTLVHPAAPCFSPLASDLLVPPPLLPFTWKLPPLTKPPPDIASTLLWRL